jgi:hypothetical protein
LSILYHQTSLHGYQELVVGIEDPGVAGQADEATPTEVDPYDRPTQNCGIFTDTVLTFEVEFAVSRA